MIFHSVESSFSKKLSLQYKLSILAGMDSFVYFVFDPTNYTPLALRSFDYQKPINDLFDLERELTLIKGMDDIITLPFQKATIITTYKPVALVPSRLYTAAEEKTYLRELKSITENEIVRSETVPGFGMMAVYSVDSTVQNPLTRHFPDATTVHPVIPFLIGCRKMMEQSDGTEVFAHFRDGSLAISVFEKRDFLFFNVFNCQSAEDVMYFSMLVFDQFKLEVRNTPFHLSGLVTEKSEILRVLQRHFGSVSFIEEIPFLSFQNKLSQIPGHLYFDLYSTSLLD